MTTCREHIELGNYSLAKEVFGIYKGNYPMCCFSMKNLENHKFLITCEWLRKRYSSDLRPEVWFTMRQFKKECKKCQEEIEELLKREENK